MHIILKTLEALKASQIPENKQNADRYRKIIRDCLYNIPNEEFSDPCKVFELMKIVDIFREDRDFINLLLTISIFYNSKDQLKEELKDA